MPLLVGLAGRPELAARLQLLPRDLQDTTLNRRGQLGDEWSDQPHAVMLGLLPADRTVPSATQALPFLHGAQVVGKSGVARNAAGLPQLPFG